MFSADTELGIPSHPFTTAPPFAQIDFTLFSRTCPTPPPDSGRYHVHATGRRQMHVASFVVIGHQQ
jgi:hypothetical protein